MEIELSELRLTGRQPKIWWLLALIFVVSCTHVPEQNASIMESLHPTDPDYLDALNSFREQYISDKSDFSLLIKLRSMEGAGIEHYYSRGLEFAAMYQFDEARGSFDKASKISPNHPMIVEAFDSLRSRELAHSHFLRGQVFESENDFLGAAGEFAVAVEAAPLDSLYMESYHRAQSNYYDWKRKQFTVDLKFDSISIKNALTFVANSCGVEVIFDTSVKDTEVSLHIDDIQFVDAVELLLGMTKNSYKVIDEKRFLVFADTKDRHKEYDDILIKVFSLETMSAKDMSAILKSVLGLKNITINEANNSLIVRSASNEMSLVERIIAENDVSRGEVILNVEILEINLSDTERLGLDYGSYQISTATPGLPIIGSIQDSFNMVTTLNVPNLSLNAFKQAVDAKSLARPSIRVLDGEKAKIHIGDRVPLRKSSIQDATGQTRTTFEYQEIGIRFNVEAKIHSRDQVTVHINLEVSSLGENLGTATEQAFRIGTRNADTTMLVNSGETAILGGLLREESRSTGSGIRGLKDTPYIGSIFGSDDRSNAKTDLLLTITPTILKRSSKKVGLEAVNVGSEGNLKNISGLSDLDKLVLGRVGGVIAAVSIATEKPQAIIGHPTRFRPESDSDAEVGAVVESASSDSDSEGIELKFEETKYVTYVDGEVASRLVLGGGEALSEISFELAFNENITELGGFNIDEDQWGIVSSEKAEAGLHKIKLQYIGDPTLNPLSVELIAFNHYLKRRGTSFLVLRNVEARLASGEKVLLDVDASKLVAK